MHVVEILEHLVGFPSVVGTPNHAIAGWIASWATRHGASVSTLTGPEGDRVNLFATIGPADRPGYILSGHMDVVPARETTWSGDPFRLRREGNRLYGRGTSDMKGFLAAALSCLPEIAAQDLAAPIHIALSYDEEAGCRGVPHLLKHLPDLAAPPHGAIIGEPSGMRAIRAHKGKASARATVLGRTGHSSRPDLALNAVHGMARVLASVAATEAAFIAGERQDIFAPPYSTLQVGVVHGGQAINVIPDRCLIELEARALAGIDPLMLLEPVRIAVAALERDGYGTAWEVLASYPGLALAADAPLAQLLGDLTGQAPLAAVSYGTEAGLFQRAGMEAIICGPGEIDRAHKADEYIDEAELDSCRAMILGLAARLRA